MLELIGRPEIPVVPGATYPLLNTEEGTRRWEEGEPSIKPAAETAAAFLVR